MICFDYKNANFNVGDNLIYDGERLVVVYITKNDIKLNSVGTLRRYCIETKIPCHINKDRFCTSFRISRA